MKGILDTQILSYYREDFIKSFEAGMEAEKPELNIKLLESRFEILKQQELNLTVSIEAKKKEIETVLASLGGELLTLKQMLVYVCKEEGACEMKLQELKEEQENSSTVKEAIAK